MPPPSSSSSPPPPSPLQYPHFTPIQERGRDQEHGNRGTPLTHQPTPLNHLHRKGKSASAAAKKRAEPCTGEDGDDGVSSVSCNKCRPHAREKITVVPLDNAGIGRHALPSPNGIFKSILASLTKKSPRSGSVDSSSSAREEQWKIALAELSHKLIHATRKRDEAVLEASRLKHSMAELEKKLNKLEIYCHSLKSGLDECTTSAVAGSPYRAARSLGVPNEQVIERFLVSVSEARSSVRVLSRSLTMQLRHIGGKVFEKMSQLLQPYDIKISYSQSPRTLVFYLEALLNKTFYEDFETVGFQKNAPNPILNPTERCESNLESYRVLRELTWDEVLNKGTKHFSEAFSRFCDRKMSEIVGMLGWNRAWPEPLLQAFFCASKSMWLTHLLANSVHPSLPVFRLDKGARFDPTYMEDMGADRVRHRLVPASVRVMVAPGFYVYSNVVKCKVLCRYHSAGTNYGDEKGLIISSP